MVYRSTQQVNSPEYMITAQQTSLRKTTPDEKINIALFDNLDLRKKMLRLTLYDFREMVFL